MEMDSIFVRLIIEDETGTFVHYDEVDLKVNITDLVQQRKEEAVQLLKGKDVDALSVEDTRAMNNLISKYENLIEEREREKLAEHCLGLSWEVIRSEWNVKEVVSLIEESIGKGAPKERNEAIKKARLFLEVLLTGDDLKFRKRAELILNHLADIKAEYENKGKMQSNTYSFKTESESPTHKGRQIIFPDLFFDPKYWEITLKALRELSLINDRGKWIGGERKSAIVGVIVFWKEQGGGYFCFDRDEYELSFMLADLLGTKIGRTTIAKNLDRLNKAGTEVKHNLSQFQFDIVTSNKPKEMENPFQLLMDKLDVINEKLDRNFALLTEINNKEPETDRMLNKKEAANLLGVSVSTIDNMRRSGFLTPYRFGKAVRFKKSELEELAESKKR